MRLYHISEIGMRAARVILPIINIFIIQQLNLVPSDKLFFVMTAPIILSARHLRLMLPDDFTRANVTGINVYTRGFDRIIRVANI